MLHLYWGDGKGKTTAAMGLALRALGHGRRVVILQFLKDGSSGEIEMLRRCGAAVYACPNAKFTWLMTDAALTCWCWTKPVPPAKMTLWRKLCCGRPPPAPNRGQRSS